jgi:hypothetical protein
MPASEPGSTANLFDIKASYLQLLFSRHNGKGVLANPDIQDRVKAAILASSTGTKKNKDLTYLGLCPGYITLLSGQAFEGEDVEVRKQIREWATEIVRGCASRPIRLEEWTELGMETIWTGLMDLKGIKQKGASKTELSPSSSTSEEETRMSSLYRWRAVLILLESNCLGQDVIEKSVLKPGKGNVIVTIAGSFGSQDPGKSWRPRTRPGSS